MYLSSLATAIPDRRYTKSECWNAFAVSDWFLRLDERSRTLAKLVLTRDNGMESRWLAIDSLAEAFAIDPDTLQQRFAKHAPRLATHAGRVALARAGLRPEAIDAVVVTTCTGYLCPGLTTYVIEGLGLSRHIKAFDLVGQGCAGALPNWQLCSALLDCGQCDHLLSICVEVSSAAMYLDDDPGVLVSACLFGDGAGAAVLSRRRPTDRRGISWHSSSSIIDPTQREALRFEHRNGLLRNVLTRAVPKLAAQYAEEALTTTLARAELTASAITGWIMHAGGRDVLVALEERLRLPPSALRFSRDTLREYGNLSSAFVYFVLDAALTAGAPGGWWWLSSFGAGFSCHGALLAVD
ncbi:MAG TPA: 3-oxoacyl-[acyl-carrier-protein] synthase III C-terminal domain-containing protein [Steroidobacteraceae bacterium]|nr:3-oxoacyl-[acyl-carrier-protein] synthase III C-terminal domain-containing protein [Steroidobacteraceae bacterium]